MACFVNASTFVKAVRRVREFDPDVVYERASSYGLGGLFSRALETPLVVELLDGRFSESSLREARAVTATDLSIIPAPYGAKGRLVSWGVNEQIFFPRGSRRDLRRELGLPQHAKLAVYVGSFCRWHGLLDLVDVAPLCPEDVQFVLLGDGVVRSELMAAVERRGLGSRFHFTGAVPYRRVPDYLAASDVALALLRPEFHDPSRPRALRMDPLKIFEYLAMGLPTVATRSANLERLFSKGEVAFCDHASPRAIAVEIMRLLGDEARRAALRQRARKEAARFTWSAHVEQLLSIFREVGVGSREDGDPSGCRLGSERRE